MDSIVCLDNVECPECGCELEKSTFLLAEVFKLQDEVRSLKEELADAKAQQDEENRMLVEAIRGTKAAHHGEVNLLAEIEKIKELATIDLLTDIGNRTALHSHFESLTAKFKRSEAGNKFALVVFDIDFFKRVNDTHGHLAGDKTLVAIVSLLKAHMRGGESIFRYGGDEFVIVLSGLDSLEDAAKAVERFRSIRKEIVPEGYDFTYAFSASFGFAFCPDHGESFEELIKRADGAAIMEKRNKNAFRA